MREIVAAKALAFDNLIQIIEGAAKVIIDEQSIHLKRDKLRLFLPTQQIPLGPMSGLRFSLPSSKVDTK